MKTRMSQIANAFFDLIDSIDPADNNEETIKDIITRSKIFIAAIQEVSDVIMKISKKNQHEFEEHFQDICYKFKMENLLKEKWVESNFFETGLDVIDTNSEETLLSYATRMGKVIIVKLLLEANANPNCCNDSGKSPLIIATESICIANSLHAATTLAERNSKKEIIHLLIQAKANILKHYEGRYVFDYLHPEDSDLSKLFFHALEDPNENKLNKKPIMYAIFLGSTELVQFLIDKKAELNDIKGRMPLSEAAYYENHHLVSLLLKLPTKLSKESVEEAYKFALCRDNLKIMKELLAYGAIIPDHGILKRWLDKKPQSDPDVLFCLNILCQQQNTLSNEKKLYPSTVYQSIDQYHQKLFTFYSIFSKKVYKTVEESIPCYIPKVLLNIIQEYDVPLQGRIEFQPDEIDSHLRKEKDFHLSKCLTQ